jgi:hypothetical protein
MPLHLLTRNPRAFIILSNCIGAIIINAITFNIPLYFQAVLLESATSSGLRLVIPTIASSVAGTATGFIITYTRRLKPPLVVGAVLLTIGTITVASMQKDMSNWVFVFALLPAIVGQCLIFPASFISVLAVSEQKEQAVVTSTLILWRSLGTVLGVAVSSLVLQNCLIWYLDENVVGPDRAKVRG